jgi:hypothetical protein
MIEVKIEPADEYPQVIEDPTSTDVAALVERRAQDLSTTITISDTSEEGRQLLVALSSGLAFVGLISDDQQYQLVNEAAGEASVEMTIGGQLVSVAGYFAVEPRYAVQAVIAFIDNEPLRAPGLRWRTQ